MWIFHPVVEVTLLKVYEGGYEFLGMSYPWSSLVSNGFCNHLASHALLAKED